MKIFKMIVRIKRPLVILLSALSLLAACKKDSNDSHEPPVTNPLSVAAAKTGDTIRITGTNFSEDVSQNRVSFNGVAGTVVSATATEIVVIVPEGATSGNVTVTVYGNTVQAGSLTISKLTLYSIKVTETASDKSYQLVSFDPATAAETVVYNLNDIAPGTLMRDIIYLPTTNEVIGIDYFGVTLIKINVATKQKTTFELSTDMYIVFDELVLDKDNNLYALKTENPSSSNSKYTLMKIDAATGKVTAVTPWVYAYSLTYLPSTNEILGCSGAFRMAKYNLTTKDTSTAQLGNGTSIEYHDLIKDNKSNLYAYKTNYTNMNNIVSQFVKIDPVTLSETVVLTLPEPDTFFSGRTIYVPQRNEFISIWNDQSLFRYNLGTNTSALTTLSNQSNIWYGYVISN